ncbi:MAG: 50S ribosomal protein L35 [Planctomycetota bacterium]|nr:MAG: 50S ribosomal protein L35 [Planctomycetota bacterium]
MPKQKTKKSVSRRMKLTKNGKLLRRHMATGHLLSPKSAKRRRKLRRSTVAKGKIAKNLASLIHS